MGFLDHLFSNKAKKAEAVKTVYSPLKGQVIPLAEVGDPVFADGMMGEGVGIIPEEGKLYAPLDGEIAAAFPTGHALALNTPDGMEILIHIGIDTVKMEGDGFQLHTSQGDHVKSGDLLVSFDIEKILSAGYKTTTMVLVSNASDLGSMTDPASGTVNTGDKLYSIIS